jgi:hypothetical protein
MITIRGLIVDDIEDWIELVTGRLNREFGRLGWQIIWTATTDVDEGHRFISTASPPYDLVVADLLFVRKDIPDRQEARGLEIITEAKQRSALTFILAISIGDDSTPDLMAEATRRGAHHVVLRDLFSVMSKEHSPAAIAEEISTHLSHNGSVEICAITAEDQDPAVQGLLNQVGRATLAGLNRKVLEASGNSAQTAHVRFLTPGASGAAVCVVTSECVMTSEVSPKRVRHVLKLSRAGDLLAQEADRGQRAADLLPANFLVQYRPAQAVGPVNGWYALGAPLVERATTLRAWLATGPARGAIEDVLARLFVDGLGQIYADGDEVPGTPLTSYAFPHHRQRRILHALDELTEALSRPDGGNFAAGSDLVANLTAFVADNQLMGVSSRSIPRQTHVSWAHGDLHGGNVLVTDGGRPVPLLIDTAEFGQAHWASDPACLAVDLLMSSVDAGAESMFFTGFNTWRQLARQFGEGIPDLTAVNESAGTAAALAALSWLAINLSRFCAALRDEEAAATHRWEWHVALAAYLLRASYRTDIPPPKRAVALVAARDQLATAARSLPAGPRT